MSSEKKQVFSLFAVQEHLRHVLQLNMPKALWVEAELSDLSQSRYSVFLSLVQRADDGDVCATASARIAATHIKTLREELGEQLPALLQKGRQLRMLCKIEYHPRYGLKYEVEDIDTEYSIGQMERQRLQNIGLLHKEQLLNKNRLQSLPSCIKQIALISSREAAGRIDFEQQLLDNQYGLGFCVELFPAAVQGVQLEREILERIAEAEQRADIDVLVITRGGGARLDLSGFDSLALCRAIAACKKPVLTAIGHEIDESLVDMVAHSSLKTPTAAAEFIIAHNARLLFDLQEQKERMDRAVEKALETKKLLLKEQEQVLDFLLQRNIEKREAQLERLENKLLALSPRAALQRGFAFVRKAGQLLHSTKELEAGDLLEIELADGKALVELKKLL